MTSQIRYLSPQQPAWSRLPLWRSREADASQGRSWLHTRRLDRLERQGKNQAIRGKQRSPGKDEGTFVAGTCPRLRSRDPGNLSSGYHDMLRELLCPVCSKLGHKRSETRSHEAKMHFRGHLAMLAVPCFIQPQEALHLPSRNKTSFAMGEYLM